jgi:hypothetical protein
MQSSSRAPTIGPVLPYRSDDLLQRLDFRAAQGAVLLAPYLALRWSGALLTISDLLFALCLFLRLCTGRLTRPFGEWTWLWFGATALLIGGLFLGSLVNGDAGRAVIVGGQYAFALVLVPLALLGRPVDQAVGLIKCALWGMVIMCAIGGAYWLSGYRSPGGEQFELVSGNGRLSGFVDNPNGLAILITLTIPLLWFLRGARLTGRAATGVALMVLLVALVLTASNTGLFGVATATLIFFAGRRSFGTLLVTALLGGALLFWGQTYLPETFLQRVLDPVFSGSLTEVGTYSGRQQLVEEAVAVAENHIAVGLGADQFRLVSESGAPVHNAYLLLLVEGGALSFIGLLMLIAAVLLTAFTSPMRPFGGLVMLTAFTVTVVFAGVLNGMAHPYGRCWFLPLLLAMSPAVSTLVRPAPFAGPVRPRRRPRAAPALS